MDLANFGDSVHWGQGHRDVDKFAVQVADALSLRLCMQAHSGATIGVGATCNNATDPEVPLACPTILDQVERYPYDPAAAQIVLITGGINDVTVQRLLMPNTTPEEVRLVTRKYCHSDMRELLRAVLAKFTNPSTRILVSSYFPVFSRVSDFRKIQQFLAGRFVALPQGVEVAAQREAMMKRIVENTQMFWTESTASLRQAVQDMGSTRLTFVFVPFTDDNAMFAAHPWLFEVHLKGLELVPEDPVAAERRVACDAFHPLPWDRQTCYIASAGHPNVPGSLEYAKAMLAASGSR